MMKISVGNSARTEFYRFVRSPYSALQALRRLKNATDSALFSLLIEKCFEFDHGFIDLTYAKLSKILGRGTRAIAEASRRLRKLGLVMVERLADGSYRWRVPVNPDEIKSNPEGRYVVREIEPAKGGGHDRSIISPMIEQGVSPMIKRSCPTELSEGASNPVLPRVVASIFEEEKEAPNNSSQYISFKNQHQTKALEAVETFESKLERDDDEPIQGKMLFQELSRMGMKGRVVRKVLKTYDHSLIGKTLKRIVQRSDLKNPVGYLICELKDGGYEPEDIKLPLLVATSGSSRTEQKPVKHSDAPIVYCSALNTTLENERVEAEKAEKEATYREEVRTLCSRFQGLTEGIKSQLKAHWTEHLERTLPNTSRKPAMIQDPTFQRMAFKEIAGRFFALIDEGLDPEGALVKLTA